MYLFIVCTCTYRQVSITFNLFTVYMSANSEYFWPFHPIVHNVNLFDNLLNVTCYL